MRSLKRALSVACAAALAVPVGAVPALAEEISETPSSAAYFNQAGSPKTDTPQTIPNAASSVDGVGPGNLGVSAVSGREDKVSFLYFSLSTVPFDAVISRAVLTVPLAPADNANVRVEAAPEKVAACAIEGSGFSTEDGDTLDVAPARKCDVFAAVGAAEGEAAYTFDITGLAVQWLEVNDGVALTRDPNKTDSFQVVFTPDATLTLEYTAPSSGAEIPDATTDVPTVDVVVPTDTGSSFDSGFGSADVPSFDTGTSSVAAPLTPGDLPAAPAPQTAGDEPVVAQRAAVDVPTEVLSPEPRFWLAALLLLGALVFLGLVLGDGRSVVATGARPTRLSRALASGRATGTLLAPTSR